MNIFKKLSNLIFGTRFDTDNTLPPSKARLMANMYYQAENRGKVI